MSFSVEEFPRYAIVEFVQRGRRPVVRDVDIVPFSWIDHEKKGNRLCAAFIPDTYVTDDLELLKNLIAQPNLPPAPESWPKFTVQLLIGHAETIDEAEKQLERLKTDVTIETDEEIKNLIKSVKKKKLLDDQTKVMLKYNNLPVIEYQNTTNLDNNETNNELTNKNLTNKEEYIPIIVSNASSSSGEKEILADPYNDPLTSVDLTMVQYSPGFETAVLSKIDNIEKIIIQNSASHINQIARLEQYLIDKNITSAGFLPSNLSKKYKINLPFNDNVQFINFNSQIELNPLLRLDVQHLLKNYLDKDIVITKSFLKMIRIFMSKNLAQTYTASRKGEGENFQGVFKKTNLYLVMKEVLVESRSSKNFATDEKAIISALSDVLSNAKSWTE